MTTVSWTPQARDDLAAIHEFIARESPHYADLVVRELIGAVARLADFPQSGRMVPELHRPDVREVLWHSYRLVYRHAEQAGEAHVLTVFRAERLLPALRQEPI